MCTFAQEIPKILQTGVSNESIHEGVYGLRGISAEGILDKSPGILIYIDFRAVRRRLIDKCLLLIDASVWSLWAWERG